MAAVQIQVDQAGAPPGVPGQAREDLKTGVAVQLTAIGGPYPAYQWSVIDQAVDIIAGTQNTGILSAPSSAATLIQPITHIGTYLVQVLVDSGSGLGANPDDVARMTFYCGATLNYLNPDPTELPRREIAFRETTEMNVPDAIFPGGNQRGWAEEWSRWYALIKKLALQSTDDWGIVQLTPGGAVLVGGNATTTVLRTSVGTVDVDFLVPKAAANAYGVIATPYRPPGGMLTNIAQSATGFTIERADPLGVLVDASFTYLVRT